jgi:hypothetical protein
MTSDYTQGAAMKMNLHTLACVTLFVAAVTILVSGAVSVHHQNALQMQQAQNAARA